MNRIDSGNRTREELNKSGRNKLYQEIHTFCYPFPILLCALISLNTALFPELVCTLSQELGRKMEAAGSMWTCAHTYHILCHPFPLPPSICPSIRVFSNESVLHIRWPKYWSFSFSISPSSEYSGLISFMMDWLDLLAVQRTLKSLLQHQLENREEVVPGTVFILQDSVLCCCCCCCCC